MLLKRRLRAKKNFLNKAGIGQTASGQLPPLSKGQTVSDLLQAQSKSEKAQMVSAKFTLRWSHYVFLVALATVEEHGLYDKDALESTDCDMRKELSNE